ncbi:MAG TPA: hypothetical protein EYH05_12545 [Anaerolineae bacterium]|nr:hypothetical protein [Anaerolineae bacterium]
MANRQFLCALGVFAVNSFPEEVDSEGFDGDEEHGAQAETAEVDGGEEDGQGEGGGEGSNDSNR